MTHLTSVLTLNQNPIFMFCINYEDPANDINKGNDFIFPSVFD